MLHICRNVTIKGSDLYCIHLYLSVTCSGLLQLAVHICPDLVYCSWIYFNVGLSNPTVGLSCSAVELSCSVLLLD